jgi:pimeloyl-ACP methyl ester carboxylesterase
VTTPVELLLLPGLDGTARFFDRLETSLDGRIPVRRIVYPADPRLGYAALTDYVISKLSGGSTVLLGESFSGPIAIKVAARRPHDIAGLILSSTFVRSPWTPAMLQVLANIDAHKAPKTLRRLAMMGRGADAGLRDEFDAVLGGLPSSLIAARLREISHVDVTANIARIKVPIKALHGRHDRLVSSAPIKALLAGQPKANCVLLDGPHMLLQVNTAEAAREIERFWETIQYRAREC